MAHQELAWLFHKRIYRAGRLSEYATVMLYKKDVWIPAQFLLIVNVKPAERIVAYLHYIFGENRILYRDLLLILLAISSRDRNVIFL